jgi:hypothetical protein
MNPQSDGIAQPTGEDVGSPQVVMPIALYASR